MLYFLITCFKKGKKKKPEIGLITGFFGGGELGIRTLGSLWEHGISSLLGILQKSGSFVWTSGSFILGKNRIIQGFSPSKP